MKQSPVKQQTSSSPHVSTARIVDGSLILSLPDAMNPIVWRLELGSVKASAMEVRKKDGARHLLVLKTARGDNHEIALFDNRDRAVHALMQISAAFQSGDRHGAFRMQPPPANQQIAAIEPPYAQPPAPRPRESARTSTLKWLAAFAAVIVAILLFTYLGSLGTPQLENSIPDGASATTTGGETSGESGVPQSADQMLRGF